MCFVYIFVLKMEIIKTDIMKILKLILAVGMLLAMYITSHAQGEQLFRSNCASCHTVGKGRLVGPDLINVHSRHDEQWLLKFIKSSQTMVKEGDPTAVQLYKEYNNVPMPDAFINEDEIKSVLAFIKTKSDENSMALSGASQIPQADNANTNATSVVKESNVNLLNMLSSSEYLLIGLISVLLIIVWMMSKTIRSLSIELERKYNSDDYL